MSTVELHKVKSLRPVLFEGRCVHPRRLKGKPGDARLSKPAEYRIEADFPAGQGGFLQAGRCPAGKISVVLLMEKGAVRRRFHDFHAGSRLRCPG